MTEKITPTFLIGYVVKSVIAPTWFAADQLKRWRPTMAGKRRVIVFLNTFYLVVAIASALAVFAFADKLTKLQPADWHIFPLLGPTCWHLASLVWAFFLWSRCTEVFYAFYRDAIAKLSCDDKSQSDLTWPLRLQLALRSYVELILDFALLYALLPAEFWKQNAGPARFTELLSYSATTITTSGAGTLVAVHPALQLLSAYEIFCGVILLVVSFAIYTSRGLGGVPVHPRLPPAPAPAPTPTQDEAAA